MREDRAPRRAGDDRGTAEPFVRFVDVTKSYDQRTLVVKRFNLSVARGEFVTLLLSLIHI